MLVYLTILSALAAGATYVGGETEDTIHGTTGDDTIDGGAGEDFIYGDLGNDILDGGADWDWIEGGAGDDIIADSDGRDHLFGGDGHDIILDSGDAQGGVDFLSGGAGNDLLHEGASTENEISLLDGGSGDDILYSEKSASYFVGGEGADIFIPHNTADEFQPEAARSAGAIFEDFTPGEDLVAIHLEGSATPEDYWFEETDNGTLVLNTDQQAGTPLDHTTSVAQFEGLGLGDVSLDDVLFVTGDELTDLLASQGADGPVLPDGGGDTTGGGDDDTTDGGGDDTTDGGDDTTDGGDDTTDGGEDTTDGGGDDTTDGGEGVVIVPDGVNAGDQTLTGTEFDDVIHAGFGDDSINGFGGDDRLIGDDGSDTIDGDAGRDTIYAGDGNDLLRVEGSYNELFGNDGDDILWTTGGGVMTGGGGNDYFLPGEDLSIITDFTAGEDQIVVPFAAAGSEGDYSLSTDADTGDTVLLRAGIPVVQLVGIPAGTITMDDIVFLDEEASYSFLNSQGTDGPSLPDTAGPSGPTEGDDVLIGTDGADSIDGLGGNDNITGNAGDDTLEGGTGADTLSGGAGEDVLINAGEIGRTDDELYGDDGNDVLINEAGTFVTLSGGAGDDILVSDDYYNTLTGGEGADIFVAATSQATSTIYPGPLHNAATDFDPAEDTLVIRVNPETFGAENIVYRFQYSDSGATLVRDFISPTGGPIPDDLIFLAGLTEADITLDDVHFMAADDLDDLIASQGPDGPTLPDQVYPSSPSAFADRITGTSGDDSIDGLGGDDVISGGTGDDTLIAGEGADTLDGGAGQDTLINTSQARFAGDQLNGGDGNDVIINQKGTVVTLSGGSGDDILVSDDYFNTLEGGEGADLFVAAVSQATSTISPGPLHNVATDFDPAEDTLVIRVDPETFGTGESSYRFVYGESGATLIRDIVGASGSVIPDELIRLDGLTEADITLDDVHFMAADDLDDLIASQGPDGPTLPDAIVLGPEFNVIEGSDGADTLTGTEGDDLILGRNSGDVINGGAGNDLIGPGDDIVDETTRQTTRYFSQPGSPSGGYLATINEGAERLDPDTVDGGDGNDTIIGSGHDLDAFGGAGDDLLISNDNGIARLEGGEGNDILIGEGGTTAEDVHSWNNFRNNQTIVSERSVLDGGAGDDVIVTAENTFSSGGDGVDTFVVRDPSIDDVSSRLNIISNIDPATETIILTYEGDTPPAPEDVTFRSVAWRDLPESQYTNPTRVTAIEVDGQTYAYLYGIEGDYNSVLYPPIATYEAMLANGQIVFMSDAEVEALQAAEAAKAQLAALSGAPANVS